MANGWTPERRARQAELIRRWRPWEKATGPKTEAGKRVASQNAYKGGAELLWRGLSYVLTMLYRHFLTVPRFTQQQGGCERYEAKPGIS